jgi:hypothetical protein
MLRLDRYRAALLAAALTLGALLAWPLRHGHAYLDDFVFIALGRHIDNPFALLYQDSLGAFFFRPLSMFLWWGTVAAFGEHAPAHLAFNVAVHVGNGLLLYTLLRRLHIARNCAALAALMFIAHPVGFSTAAWLSDRFDLFALFFGLLALIAAERFLQAPSGSRLAAIALALIAAMSSKENGFAMALVAGSMIVLPSGGAHTASGRDRLLAAAVVVACAVLALAARSTVLRDVGEVMFLKGGLLAVFAGGLGKLLAHLTDFLIVFQGNAYAVAVWLAALCALLSASLFPAAREALAVPVRRRAISIGLLLAVSTALAQAPVVHASSIVPFDLAGFLFDSLAGCRFYYLPFAGLALVLATLGDAVRAMGAAQRLTVRAGAMVTAAAVLVSLTASSRAIGRAWAVFPLANGEIELRQAVEEVRARVDFAPGCKIYFLNMPERAAPARGLLDTAVKSALPRDHPAVSCFIQTEHTPWYHLVASHRLPPDPQRPLGIISFGGRPFPPLPVANLTYYYLKAAEGPEALQDPLAIFYAYDGARFLDVTNEVRERRRAVHFYDNRPPF